MGIRAVVKSRPVYILGDPVEVSIVLYNDSEVDEYFLTWHTPFEGLVSDCLEVQKSGKRLKYDGKFVRRHLPNSKSYINLPAGDSVSVEVKLSGAYPITTPGDYSVRLKTVLGDRFAVTDKSSLEEHIADGNRFLLEESLKSKRIYFHVVHGGEPLKTLGTLVREEEISAAETPSEDLKKRGPKKPKFKGGTSDQKATVLSAHGYAFQLISRAKTSIRRNHSRYIRWFGMRSRRGRRRQKLARGKYRAMLSAMRYRKYTYILTGDGCEQPDWVAYTYRGSQSIWICAPFWTFPTTGTDSQAGVIVHEYSHSAGYTDDLVYGCSSCRKFARTNRKRVLRNASSYEYHSVNASCP